MKKMTNVEVNLINLNANDVIATSGEFYRGVQGNGTILVGARDYYDDEEEEW